MILDRLFAIVFPPLIVIEVMRTHICLLPLVLFDLLRLLDDEVELLLELSILLI